MSERRRILEKFEANKEFLEQRIAQGIEKNRKGDCRLTVTDARGNPVSNARVKVTQKSHAFRFGANLFMLDELETPEKNEKYKTFFKELFNMATLPFYWNTIEPRKGYTRYKKGCEPIYRRPAIDLCMEFCEKNGIEPREHALAYEHFFPDWLKAASVEEIKAAYEKRCVQIAERYADKIPTIEVTNELYWPEGTTAIYDEPDFVDFSFKTARKYFPHNQLCMNEGQTVGFGGRGCAQDHFYLQVERALLAGTPVDAIGLQHHMFFQAEEEYEKTRIYYDPVRIYKLLDNYARLEKPIQITEITIPAYTDRPEDEQLQAEILELLYSIWFSHEKVEQIVYWNLVDGYAHVWDPDPEVIRASQGDMTLGENYYRGGLLRFDLSPKPAYLKLKELINERWHTETELTTDADGAVFFRGFYGTYDVEITAGGQTITKTIRLTKKEKVFVL